ncbi:MAG TPA: L-type lectin-domain containing protein [Opitutaceae bacterium]|nr:L-type lectin-domain containing protein [Opitutaceae bacterium]
MQFQLQCLALGGFPSVKAAPKLNAVKIGVTAALLAALLAGSASAQTIVSFNGFASHTGLTINSSASVTSTTDGSVLRLVSAPNLDQAGSVFTNSLVNASGFSVAFDFRITNPGGISDSFGETGADGLTFALQTVAPTKVGGLGLDLGYGGISNSIAVEFDTFYNSGYDPTTGGSNHVAVDLNGSVSSASNAVGITPRFDNGTMWTAWVDYNGTVLEVRLSDSGVRPTNPTLSYTVNIPSTIGASSAYFGFTGGTGSAYSNEDVIDWAYSPTFVSGGINTPLSIPEPATYQLILAGGALLLLRRRQFRLMH